MPTLRQVNRLFLRSALIWVVVGSILLILRGVVEVAPEALGVLEASALSRFALGSGDAAVQALALGFFGNVWLIAVYSSFSAIPAGKPLKLSGARFVAVLWQVGVAGIALQAMMVPVASALAVVRVTLFVAGIYLLAGMIATVRTRMTDVSAAHWSSVIAAVELCLGTALSAWAAAARFPSTPSLWAAVILGLGWPAQAAVAVFCHSFELEPYDDQRPVYVALGAALAVVLAYSLGPQARILVWIAELVFVLTFLFMLQRRWLGRFLSWEERFLALGAIAAFFGFMGASGEPVAASIAGVGGAEHVPFLSLGVLAIPVAFAASMVAKERPRQMGDKVGRAVMAAVIALGAPEFVLSLFYLEPGIRASSALVRILFGAARAVTVFGLVALGATIKGMGRPRGDLRPV